MHIGDIETPAILIDVDKMERNLARVAEYTRSHGLRLRPHTKTHKIPALGKRQIELGAVGLTVAKTTEAEVMLGAEPPDLLVAYPVVGRQKLARLTAVAARTRVTVSLDSIEAARNVSEAANTAGVRIGILAETDVGLGRVGVRPGDELIRLMQCIDTLPAVDLAGVAFYPGHIKSADGTGLAELNELLDAAIAECKAAGFSPDVVSGGSTPTLYQSHRVNAMNEIRPGTYIFNDRNTWLCGGCEFDDCAAKVLTTVVSTSVPDRVIVDGGSKTFSSDRCVLPESPGFGHIEEQPDVIFEKMNEEHGYLDIRNAPVSWKVGDRIQILPNHICVAMNLHEKVYGVKGEEVVEVWKVEGRGKLQ
jgi:D-serine deaminase-like pyridoxal phosphate-dependent protein